MASEITEQYIDEGKWDFPEQFEDKPNINPQELAIKLYQAIAEDNEVRKYSEFHASNIAECPRAHFYKRLGLEPLKRASGALVLRWQTGHKVEEVIRPYLQKLYPNLISNVRFTNDRLNLSGEIDNYDPDSKQLIEIKSVHPQAVKYKKVGDSRNHLRDEKQYLHHEWQQVAYAYLMQQPDTKILLTDKKDRKKDYPAFVAQMHVEIDPKDWEVEKITYIYISLSGLIVPYITEVSQEILSNVKDRVEYLNNCYAAKQLPRCTCNENDPFWKMTGQYCDYQNPNDACCSPKLLDKLRSEELK